LYVMNQLIQRNSGILDLNWDEELVMQNTYSIWVVDFAE